MQDQDKISGVSDIVGLRMSSYHRQKQIQRVARSTATHRREKTMMETQHRRNARRGCGSYQQVGPGSGDKPRLCPAWGQTCKVYSKQNHFEKVCWSRGDGKRGVIRYIKLEEAASRKRVLTIREFSLVCQGWLPVIFKVGKRTTKLVLYICRKVQIIQAALYHVSILPSCFHRK